MDELLQTIAEIAIAFAGFASVVVVFRQGRSIHTDYETRVTFQSMLLGALFVVFFSLLPMVLAHLMGSASKAYVISACLLMLYICAAFIWALVQAGGTIGVGTMPYLAATLLIVGTQAAGLLGLGSLPGLYLAGLFVLLTISGFAFYSLITFSGSKDEDR